MGNQRDPLGDRMKGYERVTQAVLPRRTYTILRLDGRAFHAVTSRCERPFDVGFANYMNYIAKGLCHEVQGSVFAYVQSDEISILMQDFESIDTQPWFGGNIQKIVSVAASFAGSMIYDCRFPGAHFDARVFTIPDQVEVANYFIWRQRDATRNSILMAAQKALGHRACQGLNTKQLQEKMWQEKQINWNDYPQQFKQGRRIFKVDYSTGLTEGGLRSEWVAAPAERFTCEPGGLLATAIPPMPRLET